RAAEAFYGRMFDIETVGEDNLKEIPAGARVIFVPTHITDMDVGIALAALGRFNRDLGLVREISKDTKILTFLHDQFIDPESLFSLNFSGQGKKRLGLFGDWIASPDFQRLEESEKDIVMSAYIDPKHAGNKLELSSRKGVGAVYLAQQIKGAVIVPMAVNAYAGQEIDFNDVNLGGYLKGRIHNVGKKPKAEVHFGKPIQLPRIENLKNMSEIINPKSTSATEQAPDSGISERLVAFRKIREQLNLQAEEIMRSLSEMLPPEKRGVWGQAAKEKPKLYIG
ncbi:MAG: hypothetical protein NTY61_01980, partial [Candidatus Parcubacteria bacterium]|nr:hypothetical protein [Candidatus Parcubacteria bacterium]